MPPTVELSAERKREIEHLLFEITQGLKDGQEEEYLRTIMNQGGATYVSTTTQGICPICHNEIPIEAGINIPGLNKYIDIAGIIHDGGCDYGPRRPYPYFIIEFDIDAHALRDDIDKIVEAQDQVDRACGRLKEPEKSTTGATT